MNYRYTNINSYFDYQIVKDSSAGRCSTSDLLDVFPKSLAEAELSKEPTIEIPAQLMEELSAFRETPLFRARKFEKAIGTSCEIYVKDEGKTPSGNHKMNSACFIAYMCARDNIKRIVTETTGNWGIALAIACSKYSIEVICILDEDSDRARPDRKQIMEKFGAKVIIVEVDGSYGDLLTLSADKAIEYTKSIKGAAYVFGSVYGYFLLPQTIIGAEAKRQLKEVGRYPDIIVGSCGGGANLLGTAAEFIVDHIEDSRDIEIFAAEASSCPILSKGKMEYHSIDTLDFYPKIKTYGINGLENDGSYIGGLGSTIVAPAVAFFHQQGLIKSGTFSEKEARTAAEIFQTSEKVNIALETAYQLAAVVKKAKEKDEKVLLVNISSKK